MAEASKNNKNIKRLQQEKQPNKQISNSSKRQQNKAILTFKFQVVNNATIKIKLDRAINGTLEIADNSNITILFIE